MDKDQLTEEFRKARRGVWKKTLTYIGAGLGLVIGLAWNEAITSLIAKLFPDPSSSILAKFAYALTITVIIGFTLYYLERALERNDAKE